MREKIGVQDAIELQTDLNDTFNNKKFILKISRNYTAPDSTTTTD